jgi:hypothetical protein
MVVEERTEGRNRGVLSEAKDLLLERNKRILRFAQADR